MWFFLDSGSNAISKVSDASLGDLRKVDIHVKVHKIVVYAVFVKISRPCEILILFKTSELIWLFTSIDVEAIRSTLKIFIT